jgi:uncharacterized protein YacL
MPQEKIKTQTKKQSVIETTVNIVVGIITSFLIQLWIYPLLNIPVTFQQNLIITTVFIVVSFIRGYAIRRVFNNYSLIFGGKELKNRKKLKI